MAELVALVAEFRSGEALAAAARAAAADGYTRLEAYSPFPVEGVAETLGFDEIKVPLLTLAGGIVGAVGGYGLQVWTNLDFPLDIGGRPLIAPPAFMLITFELLVLVAVLSCIGGMLLLNRLPRLHHPIFDTPGFGLASSDRFFLAMYADDPRFATARDFLADLKPVAIVETPDTEPGA